MPGIGFCDLTSGGKFSKLRARGNAHGDLHGLPQSGLPPGKPLIEKDIRMKTLKRILIVACMLAVLAVTFGCSEEGPMEKAGKKIDKAAQEAGQQMDKAAEEAGNAAKKLFE
jgi:hypothetical protein